MAMKGKSQTTFIDFLSKSIKNMRHEINLDDDVVTSLLMPFAYFLGFIFSLKYLSFSLSCS
ncbi:hypothetical protein NMY3_00864 [Candidatus Nitrosocosmicus oleophilus]|uniref:Uncharacterized protein n=1 Tax=Candidatus Nitrosocosmicus oleophilus TaxID=1353260 RepID=A0A654LXM7_9ARCH|nr:hypothetical protein NMY3_00864 [Candidatus Nitrosocosmicus oleophilus]